MSRADVDSSRYRGVSSTASPVMLCLSASSAGPGRRGPLSGGFVFDDTGSHDSVWMINGVLFIGGMVALFLLKKKRGDGVQA